MEKEFNDLKKSRNSVNDILKYFYLKEKLLLTYQFILPYPQYPFYFNIHRAKKEEYNAQERMCVCVYKRQRGEGERERKREGARRERISLI